MNSLVPSNERVYSWVQDGSGGVKLEHLYNHLSLRAPDNPDPFPPTENRYSKHFAAPSEMEQRITHEVITSPVACSASEFTSCSEAIRESCKTAVVRDGERVISDRVELTDEFRTLTLTEAPSLEAFLSLEDAGENSVARYPLEPSATIVQARLPPLAPEPRSAMSELIDNARKQKLPFPRTRVVCKCGAFMQAAPARDGRAEVKCLVCGLVGVVQRYDLPERIEDCPPTIEVARIVYQPPAPPSKLTEGVKVSWAQIVHSEPPDPDPLGPVTRAPACPNCGAVSSAEGALCFDCEPCDCSECDGTKPHGQNA